MVENPVCTNQGSQIIRPPQATRKAAPPFDSVDADIVLWTSDHIHFFVHRAILAMGSAFNCRIAFRVQGVIPAVVRVAEDSNTLDTFLRILYLLVEREVVYLSHLRNVLVTGIKYGAPRVVASMKNALVAPRFLAGDPLRVFAIACFCQFEEEAKLAAESAVILDRVSGLRPDQCSDLNDVSAGAYFRLLQLNRTRITIPPPSDDLFPNPVNNTYVSFFGIEPFCTGRTALSTVKSIPTSTPSSSVSSEADFVSCASDSPISPEDGRRHEGGPSQVAVRKADAVPDVSCVKNLSNSAAQVSPFPCSTMESNGRLSGEQWCASASPWAHLTSKELLFSYFIAVENGRKEEALACARRLIQEHSSRDLPTLYVAKMETVGSLAYRRLLAYAQACCDAASADFELCDLPARLCPARIRSGCHERYPRTLSTASPPEWLKPHFKAARDALRDRPCGTQLLPGCLESRFVVSFLASVIADPPPCTQGHKSESAFKSGPLDGKLPTLQWQCTAEDNVRWAGTVLRQYVAAVDRAMDQVDLVIE